MLRLLSFLYLLIFLFACSATKKTNASIIMSGKVEYAIKLIPNEDMAGMESGFGNQATLYFNQHYTRIEKNNNTLGEEFYLTNIATGDGVNYIKVKNKKFALKAPKEIQPSFTKFEYTNETKKIAGYLCKKAIGKLNDKSVPIYYTTEIGINNLPYTTEFQGFALEYELPMQFGTIYYKAEKVFPGKVEANLLTPPTDYKFVNPLELQKELMSGPPSFDKENIPDFTLTDLDDKTINLKALKGKVVVLNFWFIACKPCQMEMPDLNELKAEYKGKDVVFLALTFDRKKAVQKFLKTNPFDYQIFPSARDVIQEFGIMAFPTSIVIDKDGNLIDSITGGSHAIKEQIQSMIEQALNN